MSVRAANAEAMRRLVAAEPVLVDCVPAAEALGLEPYTVLHAGPPIRWEAMCPPLQGAVVGAIRYEGWAAGEETAVDLAAGGRVRFEPCHHRGAVGPMTGIITRSMPVFVVENRTFGNRACATINEGLGRVLRFGANDEGVLARLAWLRDEAGPLLGRALRRAGGIDLRPLMAQALWMGDEMHQRNVAASALLLRALGPWLAREAAGPPLVRVLEFVAGNDQFFLNLAMAAAKTMADAAHGVERSTVVTTLARNGTEFGIRVSGLGDRWFTGPAETPVGLFFPGYGPEDANPDIGDSAITETVGLGGFALAGAPAIVQFIGGSPADALQATLDMYEITVAEHELFRIPALNFRGTPTGIDVRLVVRTGILPVIDTGIAHREPGIGQVGAGIVRPPAICFTQALRAIEEIFLATPPRI